MMTAFSETMIPTAAEPTTTFDIVRFEHVIVNRRRWNIVNVLSLVTTQRTAHLNFF